MPLSTILKGEFYKDLSEKCLNSLKLIRAPGDLEFACNPSMANTLLLFFASISLLLQQKNLLSSCSLWMLAEMTNYDSTFFLALVLYELESIIPGTITLGWRYTVGHDTSNGLCKHIAAIRDWVHEQKWLDEASANSGQITAVRRKSAHGKTRTHSFIPF